MGFGQSTAAYAAGMSPGKPRHCLAGILGAASALAVTAAWLSPSLADGLPFGRPDPYKGSASRQTRDSALRSLPLDQLDAAAQAKVNSVLSKLTIFRRLPIRVIPCDPELYAFLLDHPDVVVNTWEVLGFSNLKLEQTGPDTFRLTDPDGTHAVAQFVYRDHDTHVAYVQGTCGGPLFARPAEGSAVMVLKTGCVREPDGRHYITARLDAFVRVDNGGLELLTKAFQPIVGRVVDSNFTQTIGFVGSLSRTAEVNPAGMKRLAARLARVQPEVRLEFAEISDRIARNLGQRPDDSAADKKVAGRVADAAKK